MLREPAVSEEPFAEGGRDKLLIIKKINSPSVYDPGADRARLRARRTKKERYIERAEGPSEWT